MTSATAIGYVDHRDRGWWKLPLAMLMSVAVLIVIAVIVTGGGIEGAGGTSTNGPAAESAAFISSLSAPAPVSTTP